MPTGAGLVAGQRTGLTDWSAHQHKDLHIFSATGTFYFAEPWGMLSLVATFNHHTVTS